MRYLSRYPRLGMQRTLVIGSLCLLSILSGRAQQRSDVLAWGWVSVRVQPDSSRWALEARYDFESLVQKLNGQP